MLLILTSDKDLTADFLIVDLLKRGLPYFRLNAEDLSTAAYSCSIDRNGVRREITLGPRSASLEDVTAVWYRRALHPDPSRDLTAGERAFVAGELRHLATGIVLDPGVLWVNPIDKVSIAEHKLYQLQIARRLGMRVPDTIVSWDAEQLRRFAASYPGGTICKPIFHGLFFDGASRYSAYTKRVLPDDLTPDAVRGCPVLLQEEIPRIADVRATFIGQHCFVADIQADRSAVDWRDPELSLRYSTSTLGDNVESACRTMLKELGLV